MRDKKSVPIVGSNRCGSCEPSTSRPNAGVADEIRQLAEKTRQETENIASILSELSENAENAASAVNRSIDATLRTYRAVSSQRMRLLESRP